MKKATKVFVLLIIFATLLAVGCTGSADEETSGHVEESSDDSDDSEPAEVYHEETFSSTTVYEIGDTCSDGLTKITINGKRYADSIDEKDNEFLVAQAESGYEYLILDITLENISPDRSRGYSPVFHYKVLSPEGYTYEWDFEAATALKKALDGSDVMPGSKRRGEVPFKVPIDEEGLQLQFMWDPINNYDGIIINL